MKKIKLYITIAMCSLMILLCMACAKKDESILGEQEEIVVPEGDEISAAEAVEKIINDEDVIDISMEDVDELEDEEPVYQTVNIYYVQGNYNEFKNEEIEVTEVSAEALLSGLARHNIVPAATSVEEFTAWEDDEGNAVISLTLSKSFDDYLSTMSEEAKTAILASISDTFLEAYNADVLQIMDKNITWCKTPMDASDK